MPLGPLNLPPMTKTLPLGSTAEPKYCRWMLIEANGDHVPLIKLPLVSGDSLYQALDVSPPCTMMLPSVRASMVPTLFPALPACEGTRLVKGVQVPLRSVLS